MKLKLALFIPFIALSACSNTSQDVEDTEVNNEEDALVVEEEDADERDDNDINNNFMGMLEDFIHDNYAENSVDNFRHKEELLSTDMLELLETEQLQQQSSGADLEEERSVEKIDIYYTHNDSNKYFYVLTLRIEDDINNNLELTERYGEVITTDEDGEEKIDNLREIGYSEQGYDN